MKIFIFPLSTAVGVNVALDEDGTVLGTFGDSQLGPRVEQYESAGYTVEVVERPARHRELQVAVRLNKLRNRISGDNAESWAQVELFRWQYGELPEANDSRPLDVSRGLKVMAAAVAKGEVSWENIAVVMVYVAGLVNKGEDHAG